MLRKEALIKGIFYPMQWKLPALQYAWKQGPQEKQLIIILDPFLIG
jgi:hypothetical protein